jgi:hypothetical protein
MAVPAKMAETEDLATLELELDRVQLAAAELFGRGWSRASVARKLEWYILRPAERKERQVKRRSRAMRRLRQWERRNHFRDACWQYSLQHTDMKSGAILHGVARRAMAGRVDAAKFALELTGRYTPKGMDQPTAVQIVVNSVPRPVVKAQAVEADGQSRELELTEGL